MKRSYAQPPMNQIPKNTFAVSLTLSIDTRHTILVVSYPLLFPLIKVAYSIEHGAVNETRTRKHPTRRDGVLPIELLPHISDNSKNQSHANTDLWKLVVKVL